VKAFLSNVLVIVGCSLILYGVARLSPTIAIITGGILALVVGLNLARDQR
jgi:hypothetical protein